MAQPGEVAAKGTMRALVVVVVASQEHRNYVDKFLRPGRLLRRRPGLVDLPRQLGDSLLLFGEEANGTVDTQGISPLGVSW